MPQPPTPRRRRLSARQQLSLGGLAAWQALLLLSQPGPLAAAPQAAAGTGTPIACPAAVIDVLDGLYRWHIASQDDRGPLLLTSQRQRFSENLYRKLVQAAAMTPADGGFIDFDVFSGTQVSTFSARVTQCRAVGGRLEAVVAVEAGLRRRPDQPPKLLLYTLEQQGSGQWRIVDITYQEEPMFRLSEFLDGLLRSKP